MSLLFHTTDWIGYVLKLSFILTCIYCRRSGLHQGWNLWSNAYVSLFSDMNKFDSMQQQGYLSSQDLTVCCGIFKFVFCMVDLVILGWSKLCKKDMVPFPFNGAFLLSPISMILGNLLSWSTDSKNLLGQF